LASGDLTSLATESALSTEQYSSGTLRVDPQAIIGALKRRWKLIVACVFLPVVAGFGALQLMTPIYQSSVELLVFDPQTQSVGVLRDAAPPPGLDTATIATEIELIKSLTLCLRVARELKLDQEPEFQIRTSVAPSKDVSAVSELRLLVAASVLRDRLRVERIPFSYVLVVSATARDPELAQRIAAKVVEDYLASQQEAREAALQQLASGLELKQKSLKENLHLLAEFKGTEDFLKIQELQRKITDDSKLYDAYLAQYNELKTRESLPSEARKEKVIAPAMVPSEPVSPRRSLFLAIAGAVGLMVAVVIVFLVEYGGFRVRSWVQAEQLFGLRVIGALPLIAEVQSDTGTATRELVTAMAGSAPSSPLSEAVSTMRLRLQVADKAAKVIMVTSFRAGEGKSAVASLLAASSAAAGKRTLLVDCDFRRHTISNNFSSQKTGLSEVLAGVAELSDAIGLNAAVGCYLLSAGSSTRNPSDLLVHPRMDAITAALREQYDYIVIDTPPLLSAVDALALARTIDKILVVVDGSRRGSYGDVITSLETLRRETDRIAGLVFNKVDPRQVPCYGYDDYNYGNSQLALTMLEGELRPRWWLGQLGTWGDTRTRAGLSRLTDLLNKTRRRIFT
jgi:capsular exopolysaccharide synthesis family protein